MPPQISITDDDILKAETMLLPTGEHFDTERKDFIKNLTTVDLQACPGSGKTTCLLTKLLILGKHLPFEDGRGILVLSHTNTAIDEIKNKIYLHYPCLFRHPNFIGTIQSFVDYFLATPFYAQKYGRLPYRIDDEIFEEKIWEPCHARGWLNKQRNKDEFLRSLRFDINGDLICGLDGNAGNFPLKNKANSTYRALHQMRKKLLDDGYLCFEDAFYLAECYISEVPKIIDLVQKRFVYVFIDEMQDTDVHQARLLEKLFPSNGCSIIQRIGDQNQAIYNRRVKAENVWVPRAGFLTLNGSKRLSESIASTIKNISLIPQSLIGNNKRKNIKPKIIIFDDASIKKVPHKFGELVVLHNLHKDGKSVFKAVGWRKTPSSANGLIIGSYFDGCNFTTQRNRIDFQSLDDYLSIDRGILEVSGLYTVRKNILNAILKAIRIAGINKSEKIPFSLKSFMAFLKEYSNEKYDDFKLRLYKWSYDIYFGIDRRDDIKQYLISLLQETFACQPDIMQKIQPFLVAPVTSLSQQQTCDSAPINIFKYQSQDAKICVEIGTIHSVKGETHTATLYLETYYYNDGGKSYESQRIIDQLKGKCVDANCGVRVKESLKMAYVGMSRPTDLLCLAIHKSRIAVNDITELQNNWDIIDLTTQ